jgi:hypothetical protein
VVVVEVEEEEEATVARRVPKGAGEAGSEGPHLLAEVPRTNQTMRVVVNGLVGRRLRQRFKDAGVAVVVVVVVAVTVAVDLHSLTVLWLPWSNPPTVGVLSRVHRRWM